MNVLDTGGAGGSLQISTEAISKIAQLATMEIEGVADTRAGTAGVKGLFRRVVPQKPVEVLLLDDVAEITVSIHVYVGTKIPSLCERIQENVKAAVQSMTGITVSRVHITVTGVVQPAVVLHQAE